MIKPRFSGVVSLTCLVGLIACSDETTSVDPLGLTITGVAATEGNSGTKQFVFVVTLVKGFPVSDTVSVDYSTADGTAKSNTDYTSKTGKLVFPPTKTSDSIAIDVRCSTTLEPDETFYAVLSNPSGAPIALDRAVGTILNDDTLTLYSTTAVGGGSAIPNTLFSVNRFSGSQHAIGLAGQTAEQYSLDGDPASGFILGVKYSTSIVSIDPTDGTTRVVANINYNLTSIAFSPSGGIYATATTVLGLVDIERNQFVPKGRIGGAGSFVSSIDFSPQGTLYAVLRDSNGKQSLVTVDTTNATITSSISITGNFSIGDIDFAADGFLYATNFSWLLLRIDPTSAALQSIGFGSLGALGGIASTPIGN